MFDSQELLGRIVEWFETGKGRPFMLELRPTNLCNLRCPSCVARGYPHYVAGEEISDEEYLRIIDEAAGLGVRYVQIVGGGEPFVRRDKVLKMMHLIKQHGMSSFVVTNGTLFDETAIREIVEMKWDVILLSLDAPEQELNDFLRGKEGSFDALVGAVRLLARYKKQKNSHFPTLVLGPVLSHYNCRSLTRMVQFAAELKVDKVMFQPVRVRKDQKGKPFLLTEEDLEALQGEIPRAMAAAEDLGMETNLQDIGSEMLRGSSDLPEVIRSYATGHGNHPLLSLKCYSPWFYMGINPDGKVGPCSIDHPTTYKGNIKGSRLEECWNSHQFQSFRDSLAAGDTPEACKNCCGTTVIEIRKIRERLKDVVGE